MSKSVAESHYDERYFAWQNESAKLGSRLNAKKFRPFIRSDARSILDFGCGGGHLLNELPGERKLGIEINPTARDHAKRYGYEVYPDLSSVEDAVVDCVISNHALEHVENPLQVMREVKRVLRPGGQLILVVPCDRANYPYLAADRDFHLYSWSSGNLANLAKAAGFSIDRAEELVHRWPPLWNKLAVWLPPGVFDSVCRLWGQLRRDRTQVRLVATADA